jgi:hypothetical protein
LIHKLKFNKQKKDKNNPLNNTMMMTCFNKKTKPHSFLGKKLSLIHFVFYILSNCNFNFPIFNKNKVEEGNKTIKLLNKNDI